MDININNVKFAILLSVLTFLFCIIFPILIESKEGNNIFDYARITDVDYKAELLDEVNNGGNVLVTETITFDIHAASKNNLFWELWRDLPESYEDGLKVDYEVLSVKEILDNGIKKEWTESPSLYWYDYDYTSPRLGPGKWYHSKGPFDDYYNYECLFFYIDGIYRDTITFEIQYIMHNAALKYSDMSELYLAMYSESGVNHLKSFNAEILIPYKDMPSHGNYLAHTFGTDNNVFEFTESKNKNPGYHTFYMNLDEKDLKFSPYNEYIEFTLLAYNEDKHIFTNYAPDNNYSNDEYLEEALMEIENYDNLPYKSKIYKTIGLLICICASILLLFKTFNIKRNVTSKHKFYEPTQKFMYFRDIPNDLDPYFAATFAFCKNKKKANDADAYSAIMLNLVRKGYIKLDKIDPNKGWTNNNIMIEILYIAPDNFNLPITNTNNNLINNNFNTKLTNQPGLNNCINTNQPKQLNQQNLFENNNNMNSSAETTTINTLVVKRMDKFGNQLEELTSSEKAYFNLIVRHSTNKKITMSLFRQKVSYDYDKTNEFVTAVDNSIANTGITGGYFQKSNYLQAVNEIKYIGNKNIIFGILLGVGGNLIINNTRLDLLFGGLFIFAIALILSGIYYNKIACKYVLLTQYGEDEYEKWRGLYNFLNNKTLINEKNVIDVKLWEKYLVYATAFGISENVVKALKVNCPNITNSQLLNNNYYYSTDFKFNNKLFRNSVRKASYTSRYASFSGHFSGGYGGGGRGGGSGGGGH